MNNPSPLLPHTSLLEQKNKGRAKVKIAVFFVLAIHGIGLLALLMQGCRKEPAAAAPETNNATPQAFDNTNPPPTVDTSSVAPVLPSNPPPVVDVNPTPPPAVTEYTILAGDLQQDCREVPRQRSGAYGSKPGSRTD